MNTSANELRTPPDGIEALRMLSAPPGSPELGEAYDSMIGAARRFVDQLSLARIDQQTAAELEEMFDSWATRLRPYEVHHNDRLFGRWPDRDGRGQFMIPAVTDVEISENRLTGRVTFGAFHLGGNGAAHGGSIMAVFDDSLGRLSHSGRAPARTAYLKVDFRAVVPYGRELTLRCWLDRVEGRKRYLHSELRLGDTLCAEAEGLWVELRPGQP